MPTSKEDLIRSMPREKLESIVIDATARYASLSTELDRTRTDLANSNASYNVLDRQADNFAAIILGVSIALVISLIFIGLLATGVL